MPKGLPITLHIDNCATSAPRPKGERIILAALQELIWREGDLGQHPKARPAKLALAARLRRETTLTVREIAGRLQMGSWKV